MADLFPQGLQTFNGDHGTDPRVRLELAGVEALYVEQYSVNVAVLTQPAAFRLTLGRADNLARLIEILTPNTPFSLFIGDRQLMTGRLDGLSVQGTTGVVQVDGRDALAPLHDAQMRQEQTYKDDTYAAMVRKVMDDVGLQGTKLVYSNKANRQSVTGLSSEAGDLRDTATLKIESGAGGTFAKHAQSQLGETAYQFLKRHLDRAGLFLWAGADGSYILSEPHTYQHYLYYVLRTQGRTPESSDVLDCSYSNKTTGRFSEVSVYTRGEQKRKGRATTVATYPDNEMKTWGFNRPKVMRDANADTDAKATFMAKRLVAESRRAGWKLSYTMSRHVTGSPRSVAGSPRGPGEPRLLWYPDTLVYVEDQRLGIEDEFWLESVTYAFDGRRTTTQIELMRRSDLVFGEQEPPKPVEPARSPPDMDNLPADLAP